MQYNIRGQKTRMYDADTGQTRYVYNALGELVSQTDAKAQTVSMQYDRLGRMVQRQEPEGMSTWTYDTQPKGIGKLAAVTGPNGYQESYRYNGLGRMAETHTQLNGQNYFVSTVYDQYGRVESLTYPTSLAVQNTYNEHGYLADVQRASDNQPLWQAKRLNARGQLEQVALGNGLVTDKVYTPTTGRIQSIQTGGGVIQNLAYTFDKLGNLTQRTNRHLVETFQYDGLNRLTQTAVQGVYSTTITYDALGNITSKSDVGSYTYGENGAGPHAVTSISGLKSSQYTYDANGNRITSSATGQQIEYTSFNKPRRISQGNTSLEFEYGPNYSRYQQKVTKAGQTTTTTYISGGLMEREVDQNWVKDTHYLFAGGESIAVHIQKNHGIAEETRYLHKDHLGSIDAITEKDGQPVESFSFDAWGQRRHPDSWNTLTDAQLGELILNNTGLTTSRGFTGHEHLDEVQLIHTNGRLYDPVIGRFLSADPFVQAPTFSQSLNRYSYVMNNPLSLVDPSGFFLKKLWNGIKKAVKAVGKFVKKYWKPIVATVAGIALGVVTGGLASGFVGAVLSGTGFGFGSAFAGTMLGGGSIGDALKAGLKGAVIGGVTAGLTTYGVNSLFAEGAAGVQLFGKAARVAKIVANGVVTGLSSLALGGKFERGFIWSVATGTLNYLYGRLVGESPRLLGIGKTADPTKGKWDLPTNGSLNFGIQGGDGKVGWLHEGQPVTDSIARYVPFMNATSGMHDFMQVAMTFRSDLLRNFLNVPYMLPAALITVGAYMGEKQYIPPPSK
ncbi:MAG TPA: hypothetical protein ENI48_03590 [Thioploca sp.]|nr:hypothetical protein [Thioploca sp.]